MKKMFFILFAISILTTTSFSQVRTDEKKMTINKVTGDTTYTESIIISEEEDITTRNHMFVVNPLKFFLFYNISYFHKISESAVIGGGFQIPTQSNYSGFGLNAEIRLYPSGKNMKGFYIAPNISYSSITRWSNDENIFSFGALAGWQWFPGDEFAIGLGLGVDYYFESSNNDDYSSYNGTKPALRFDIGYAW